MSEIHEYKLKFDKKIHEQEQEFEKERHLKKDQWKLEQEKYLQDLKDKDERLKKERKREEEEYKYNLELERKKDHDSYLANKINLEKELKEKKINFDKECAIRQANLTTQEEEFKNLKKQVDEFPTKLESTIKTVERRVQENIEREYNYKIELTSKEVSGEKKLMQQQINGLQDKIKEQDSLIKQLSQKADLSSQQVQSIALKALESAGAKLCEQDKKAQEK